MKNRTNKILAVALAVTLLALAIVVGTLAYLADTNNVVTNTFTVGANVNITLTETGATPGENGLLAKDYKIVPGTSASKDPKITVADTSDTCYLFFEVIKTNDLDTYVDYDIATGWTQLTLDGGDTREIYYLATAVNPQADDAVLTYSLLAGDTVSFKDVDSLPDAEHAPTLTFKGYAIQAEGFTNYEDAWDALDAQMNP